MQIFDGPGPDRAWAHEMWALYGPPWAQVHPAHEAAHLLSWAGPGRGP